MLDDIHNTSVKGNRVFKFQHKQSVISFSQPEAAAELLSPLKTEPSYRERTFAIPNPDKRPGNYCHFYSRSNASFLSLFNVASDKPSFIACNVELATFIKRVYSWLLIFAINSSISSESPAGFFVPIASRNNPPEAHKIGTRNAAVYRTCTHDKREPDQARITAFSPAMCSCARQSPAHRAQPAFA